ncbi:MAG: hypothetical protein AABY07_06010 [Nanoarchaeota archaeon]
MERTTLETALECVFYGANIDFGNRRFIEDIKDQAQIDDSLTNMDSAQGIRDVGYREATFIGLQSGAQTELTESSLVKLLFERRTEIKNGFGLKYSVRARNVPEGVTREQVDKRIKDRDYEYELVSVFFNMNIIFGSGDDPVVCSIYEESPLFYFHVRSDQQVFKFDILRDEEDVPSYILKQLTGMKLRSENKPLDAAETAKSLLNLLKTP